jgi:PhnB protein
MAIQPIPDGYHTVTPYLTIRNASDAIDFYRRAFGATELAGMADPTGKIANAEIQIGSSRILIRDETQETPGPEDLGGSPVMLHLYVEDVDHIADRAVAAGAKVLIPVGDQFYGDRSGRFADPFGHIWIISTHKEDVSSDEMRERASSFMTEKA